MVNKLSSYLRVVLMIMVTVVLGAAGQQALAHPPADLPELFVNDNVTGMAMQGTTLYWHTDCGDDFSPGRSRLRSKQNAAPSRAAFNTLYFPATCDPTRVASGNVAFDDSYVYWLSGDGHVDRLALSATDGTAPTVISQMALASVGGFPSCCWLAVDSNNVFWSEGGNVFFAPKAGGPRTQIVGVTPPIRDLMAGGDGTVFYRAGSTLTKLVPSGAGYAPQPIADNVVAYALSTLRVYYAVNNGANYVIMSKRRSLDDPQTHYASDSAGSPSVDALTLDGVNIYWHERRNGSGGPIFRLPRGGGSPVALTSYTNIGSPLLTDGTFLFWTDYNLGIYRLSTGAVAVTRPDGDIWVTGVEVTQAIQTTDNLIPLIGYKVTFVRVYVQSREDSNGPWTNVSAQLTVDGSTRTHSARWITVSPTGSNRSTLDDSFLFVLDPGETAPGTRNIHVTIYPSLGRPETNTTNNTLTAVLTFDMPIFLTVTGITYGNTNNPPDSTCGNRAPNGAIPPFSDFEAHRQFVENVYPVSYFSIVPLPGASGHLQDDSDCLGYVHAHTWALGQVDRAFPEGGRTGYLLTPENGPGYHGWCCGNNIGNPMPRGENLRADPGPIMAQELGHSLGSFFGCGHTWDPCFHYPRPTTGDIGYDVGMRINPLQTMPGHAADGSPQSFDFMSYSVPFWVSPYVYCNMLDILSASSPLYIVSRTIAHCPASVEGGRAFSGGGNLYARNPSSASLNGASTLLNKLDQTSDQYLYVAGTLNHDGTATFEPFEIINYPKNIATKSHGQTYSLEFQWGDGSVHPQMTFDAAPPDFDETLAPPDHKHLHTPDEPSFFSMYVPWSPQVKQITLRQGGKVLAQRAVSPNAPKITLTSPQGGENWSGKQTVSWNASDADGDKLFYSVWYSADGGQTWTPIDHNLTNTSLTINFDDVPGSDKAMIRVLASDGVNTTAALLPAVFKVPRKAPQASISSPSDGATFEQNQDFVLQGSAFDWEDCPLTDAKAFSWTSDKDGALGSGRWIVPRLSPGAHTLTLTARDSDGNTTRATVHVTISALQMPIQPTAVPTMTPTPIVFQITSLKISVTPAEFTGLCPATFTFSGRISGSGQGKVAYRWERSDGSTSPNATATLGKAGFVVVKDKWVVPASGAYSDVLHVLSPNDISSQPDPVVVNCASPTPTVPAQPAPNQPPTVPPNQPTNVPPPTQPPVNKQKAQVTGAKVSVQPPQYQGQCPTTFTFAGVIVTNGATTVSYRWERSDGGTGATQTLTFSGAGAQTVTTTWTLGGSGMVFNGWAVIHVLTPNDVLSDKTTASFALNCAK